MTLACGAPCNMSADVLSGGVTLADETCNDSAGGVLGVERVAQLLTRGIQLLLGVVCAENECVPFVLEQVEERGDGRVRWGPRRGRGRSCDTLPQYFTDVFWMQRRTCFDRHKVRLLQFFARHRVCAVLGDVFDDEAALVDVPGLGDDGLLGRLT